MLKKKLGGGLLLSYDKVKKREIDAKSGSVLPTTPRIKGIAKKLWYKERNLCHNRIKIKERNLI